MRLLTNFQSFQLSAIAVCLALFAVVATPNNAHANAEVEAYVQELADKVTGVLSNETLSTDDKAAQLRTMIDQYLNVPAIAKFTLGRYRRDAEDQGVLDEFIAAFKAYAISIYETRLTEYGGQKIRVTGSVDPKGKGKDFVVKSVLEGNAEPLELNWRVVKGSAGFSVVDVQVADIWMGLDLREQFASIISNNNGQVSALIEHLKASTQ